MAALVLVTAAGHAQAQSVCTADPGNPTVRFDTSFGSFDVLLCRADVQATVDNFLMYVNSGAYTDAGMIHRSVKPPDTFSVIQGGGAWVDTAGAMHLVATEEPVVLEAGLLNLRGTIAMARTGEANSATSQWFINVADNPALDPAQQPPGFAVFGEVLGNGMTVVDMISAQDIWALNGGFLSEVPLDGMYVENVSVPSDHFVYVTDVSVVPEPATAVQGLAALGVIATLASRRRRAAR